MLKIKELFDTKPCNTGRQPEIDLFKAEMLLELVFCHCFIECSSDERLLHGFPFVMDSVIGGPLGAPGFMISMGIGMIYTRHNSPKEFAKRGITLAFMAYLLNIFRFTLPFLTGYAITGDYDKYMSGIVYMTLENDILMFAALSFFLMAILLHFKTPPWAMIVIGFAMSGLATFMNGIDLGNDAANIFVGYFFGTEDAAGNVCSYFTLFNWFVVTAFGYVYGYYYSRLKNKTRFHLIFAVPAALLTTAYLIYGITTRSGVFGEGQLCYYHISTYDVCGALCAATARMGLFYALSHLVPQKLSPFIRETAANVTAIYCIQWVLIIVITNLVLYICTGTQELPDLQTSMLAISITAASIVLAHYYKKVKYRWRKKINEKKTDAHN